MSTIRPARSALFDLLTTEFAADGFDVVYGSRFRESATTIAIAGVASAELEPQSWGARRNHERYSVYVRVLVDRLGAVTADEVDEEWTTIHERIRTVLNDNPTLGVSGVCWAIVTGVVTDPEGAVMRPSQDGWTIHGHVEVGIDARIPGGTP